MGTVIAELVRVAQEAKVSIKTCCPVDAIEPLTDGGGTVHMADGQSISADTILVNCAPATLDRLLGRPYQAPVGNQIKINIVVCGGSLVSVPGLSQASASPVRSISARAIPGCRRRTRTRWRPDPDPVPCEIYCHTLTDGSILGSGVAGCGYRTLTLFGMHAPASLFAADQPARGNVRRMRRCAPFGQCSLNRWSPAWPSIDEASHASR